MANMSYCRFQNTVRDLADCKHNLTSVESVAEAKAALKLFRLCEDIATSYDVDTLADPNEIAADAIRRMGYGGGALAALDYWELLAEVEQ